MWVSLPEKEQRTFQYFIRFRDRDCTPLFRYRLSTFRNILEFQSSCTVHSECVFENLEDILCKIGNKEMPLAILTSESMSGALSSGSMSIYCNGSSSNFLHCWEIKRVESVDEHLTGNVYNIENDVIHNCQEICTTSKTMLYTICTKCV